MKKCCVNGCENEAIVAGPSHNRSAMICWEHAVRMANNLSQKTPAQILRETLEREALEKERILRETDE